MLLMPGSRKRAVTLILGSAGPSEDVYPKGPESDKELALMDAGQKVLTAMERKDVKAFVDYMKELVYLCEDEDESESEPML